MRDSGIIEAASIVSPFILLALALVTTLDDDSGPLASYVVNKSYGQSCIDSSRSCEIMTNLGQALFFDVNLSAKRTQSCATCHDPERAFTDARPDPKRGAVSLGADGHSYGARNAPSVAYARFSPPFRRTISGDFFGGQFWDGRADTLEAQAGGPILNPVEMGMASKASVVARLRENEDYVAAFQELFGPDIFTTSDTAFAALRMTLATYERSAEVSPFDSKYDRFLKGEYQMTPQEGLGRMLFFSEQQTSCSHCHWSAVKDSVSETFSNYSFHNIGVPRNPLLDNIVPDHGLRDGRGLRDARQDGRFKVPSLRNVAVTAPYMHNGAFANLRTAVLFHDKYNSRNQAAQLNPETGQPWGVPELEETVSATELHASRPLESSEVDALVAFLKTLTDKRYEPLLPPQPG
ncbi:putative methylamine utilization protein [Azorhizobium caulinodans ORS 571]|uniref:Putative methylamine utilization protein n=1 Tax=Azorhizobium caulinodans (strain ATCC 43989 / DSM 5975 / JCM 20966 / LMG 6465 / NBRC 14845 / NCIMB 13405 / ORS 571) TaxID=438753 RepID=A8IP25_AZOC5|nr:cytochrome c peroxidase [Azorhizobium caulinodans]BAF89821.1 putative methylamine utilization protein [Azorhizobium caulinodans ORS 571]